jgi:hypothetical protein
LSFHLQKKIVAGSNAIGLCTKSSIEPEINQGELAILPLDLLDISSDYGITYLNSRELSQINQKIIEFVLDVDKSLFLMLTKCGAKRSKAIQLSGRTHYDFLSRSGIPSEVVSKYSRNIL